MKVCMLFSLNVVNPILDVDLFRKDLFIFKINLIHFYFIQKRELYPRKDLSFTFYRVFFTLVVLRIPIYLIFLIAKYVSYDKYINNIHYYYIYILIDFICFQITMVKRNVYWDTQRTLLQQIAQVNGIIMTKCFLSFQTHKAQRITFVE